MDSYIQMSEGSHRFVSSSFSPVQLLIILQGESSRRVWAVISNCKDREILFNEGKHGPTSMELNSHYFFSLQLYSCNSAPD